MSETPDIESNQNVVHLSTVRSLLESEGQESEEVLHGLESLMEEFEALESHMAPVSQQTYDHFEKKGLELLAVEMDSLSLPETFSHIQEQMDFLKEAGERLDYLMREIETFLPRRK